MNLNHQLDDNRDVSCESGMSRLVKVKTVVEELLLRSGIVKNLSAAKAGCAHRAS
jgi:hypothetical protein